MKLTELGVWITENIFELIMVGIVISILIYSFINNDTVTIDKILAVALVVFKGVTKLKRIDEPDKE